MTALGSERKYSDKSFRWSDFAHPWPKNGVAFSPKELGQHLKLIIKAEKTRIIPKRPLVPLSQR